MVVRPFAFEVLLGSCPPSLLLCTAPPAVAPPVVAPQSMDVDEFDGSSESDYEESKSGFG